MAVIGCSQASPRSIELRWKHEWGYKSAYSWVDKRMGQERVDDWNLKCSKRAYNATSGSEADTATHYGAAAKTNDSIVVGVSPMVPPKPEKVVKIARMTSKQVSPPSTTGLPLGHGDSPWTDQVLVQKVLRVFADAKMDDGSSSYCWKTAVCLGKTNFSTTYDVKSMDGQRLVAKVARSASHLSFLHEVHFLCSLSHPNIVRLVDVVRKGGPTLLTAHGGPDLRVFLRRWEGVLRTPSARRLVTHMFDVVAYLHGRHIVHTDLKPANMVVDEQEEVLRLIDLGCAIVDMPDHRTIYSFNDAEKGIPYGTLPYRAIEVLLGDAGFGAPMDVWACGCIVFEVFVGARLFRPSQYSIFLMAQEILAQLGMDEELATLGALPRWAPPHDVHACCGGFPAALPHLQAECLARGTRPPDVVSAGIASPNHARCAPHLASDQHRCCRGMNRVSVRVGVSLMHAWVFRPCAVSGLPLALLHSSCIARWTILITIDWLPLCVRKEHVHVWRPVPCVLFFVGPQYGGVLPRVMVCALNDGGHQMEPSAQ